MKNKKVSVSIGIPVHNEAENISNLLESIIKQKSENYVLENISVVCDGTTDGTDIKVKEFSKDIPFIRIINDKKRKGKLQRLTQIYKKNISDLIIVFDGDVILGKPTVLDEIVKQFDTNVIAVVSANNQPLQSKTFIGKLINQWSHIWYLARLNYKNGNNIHNIRGCGMAMRKNFAKTISFPANLASESQFIYFSCLTQKKAFKFAKNAIVLYRKPDNIHDYFLQTRRSVPEETKLDTIFGNWIHQRYIIPKKYTYLALAEALFKKPLLTLLATGLQIYLQKIPYENLEGKKDVLWKRSTSTKSAIPVNF